MTETITTDDALYALNIVKSICAEVGPGMPGTPQERRRAAMIQDELQAHLGAENVVMEEFTVAPWAWLSSYPLSALFLLMAALFNIFLGTTALRLPPAWSWLTAALELAFAISAPLPFILVFTLNHELLDPFFPKRQSVNVIGTLRRPDTDQVKRLLILSAHHDSAPENTWLRFAGYGFLVLTAAWMFAFVTMPVLSLIHLTGLVSGNAAIFRSGTLGWFLLVFPIVPAILFGLFFNRGRKNGGNVPGAVDNLSGSALVAAACRFLVQNPNCIPADTEIRFITFGSEEAGLRGSRRYVERHLDELKRLDTRLVNIETVAQAEIGILTTEMNGSVRTSPELVKSLVAAAEIAGVPYRLNSASLGASSDAGPFCQAGLRATTLLPFRVPQQMLAFYHTKRDTPERLEIDALLNVLKLIVEWLRGGGE